MKRTEEDSPTVGEKRRITEEVCVIGGRNVEVI
jgi:hypothetical protein